MSQFKKVFVITAMVMSVFSFAVVPVASADVEAKTRELLKLMQADKVASQMVTQMIGSFRQAKPEVPAEVWNALESELVKSTQTELMDLTIGIYKNHFSESDIQELINFYESPVGQKFISKQTIIAQESFQGGQVIGNKIAQKVIADLEEKG